MANRSWAMFLSPFNWYEDDIFFTNPMWAEFHSCQR
jgi:hypothetical protein